MAPSCQELEPPGIPRRFSAFGETSGDVLAALLLGLIPLASDPFGFGWDLFGTTLYRINIGIVDALRLVHGSRGDRGRHVVATWLAHETALLVFETSTSARRSQGPMLVLMVGYTVLSLSILSQPIVEP